MGWTICTWPRPRSLPARGRPTLRCLRWPLPCGLRIAWPERRPERGSDSCDSCELTSREQVGGVYPGRSEASGAKQLFDANRRHGPTARFELRKVDLDQDAAQLGRRQQLAHSQEHLFLEAFHIHLYRSEERRV